MKNASGMIKGVQLALAGLSGILATAVVGTAAHTYSVFHSQRSENNPWYLPLWPEHFDVTGTKAAIGTGVVVMVLNFGLLAITLIPKVRKRLSHSPIATYMLISIQDHCEPTSTRSSFCSHCFHLLPPPRHRFRCHEPSVGLPRGYWRHYQHRHN